MIYIDAAYDIIRNINPRRVPASRLFLEFLGNGRRERGVH